MRRDEIMSKITEIKQFKMTAEIECDCGTIFEWRESTTGGKNKDKCPKCGIKYGMVLAPKKLNVPAEGKVDDFFKSTHGSYV